MTSYSSLELAEASPLQDAFRGSREQFGAQARAFAAARDMHLGARGYADVRFHANRGLSARGVSKPARSSHAAAAAVAWLASSAARAVRLASSQDSLHSVARRRGHESV
jgi:hypothetical protein